MIEVVNRDCIEGMKEMDSETVDVICTSPPYNLKTKYRKYNDSVSRQEYLEWCENWLAEASRILSRNGSLFLNMGNKPSDPLVPLEVLQVALKFFKLQNTIHWIKSISIQDTSKKLRRIKDTSTGHFKPINSKRFLNGCHEYVFHLTHTGNVELDRLAIGVEYQDKSNAKRWENGKAGIRCRGNTWYIPYQTIQSKEERKHPAVYPVELPEMCVMVHGVDKVNLVVDPFMGIGSTGMACKRLGVDCIGFEMDEEYCKIAERNCT